MLFFSAAIAIYEDRKSYHRFPKAWLYLRGRKDTLSLGVKWLKSINIYVIECTLLTNLLQSLTCDIQVDRWLHQQKTNVAKPAVSVMNAFAIAAIARLALSMLPVLQTPHAK